MKANNLSDVVVVLHGRVEVDSFDQYMVFIFHRCYTLYHSYLVYGTLQYVYGCISYLVHGTLQYVYGCMLCSISYVGGIFHFGILFKFVICFTILISIY